jgi:hypothetical protein
MITEPVATSVICVSGGIVSGGGSTVHSWTAAVPSTFPAASVARTRNVWSPTARLVYSSGD